MCHECYNIPAVDLQPDAVRILLISEAVPQDRQDDYYAGSGSLFERTTLQAFADAGYSVNSIAELLGEGIYFTSAVKCAKTGYEVQTQTIRLCSHLLEKEIALFPNVQVYLLMGDVAIRALKRYQSAPGRWARASLPEQPTRSAAGSSPTTAGVLCPPTCKLVPASSLKRASAG